MILPKSQLVFTILAGTSVNTVFHFKVTHMYIEDTEATFTFDKGLKHSRSNYKQSHLHSELLYLEILVLLPH